MREHEGHCLFSEQCQYCLGNEDVGTVKDNYSGLYFILSANF